MPRKKGSVKGAKRDKKAKRVKKTASSPAPRARGGTRSAITELNNLRYDLLEQRSTLDEKIGSIENTLKMLGGGPRPGGKPGPRGTTGVRGIRAGGLKDYITRVLGGRGVMAVKDVTGAVVAAGYKSRNKTLGKSVGIALKQMPNVRKVGRGQFKLS